MLGHTDTDVYTDTNEDGKIKRRLQEDITHILVITTIEEIEK